MNSYHYPDFNDTLIIKFLEKFEHNDPYWEESEREIINRIFDHMKNRPDFMFNNYLDAGCGRGRLLWVFRKHFQLITGIEPDINRYKDALGMAAEFGIVDKSELINVAAEDFRSSTKFDLILSSHVIQHIHTDTVLPLMENLKDHLSESGVIALTTCHSTGVEDQYGNNYMNNGSPVRASVTKEEFNSLVDGKGMLPVHYFNSDLLIADLASVGLKTIDFRVFHVSREDRNLLQMPDVDNYVNSDTEIQKSHGVDMYLLLERA